MLLDRDADRLDALPLGPLVNVHRLTNVPGRGLMAVRPDGYIGLRCQIAEANQLIAWLALAGVEDRTPASAAPDRPQQPLIGQFRLPVG